MKLAQHSLSLCDRQGIPASLVFMDLDKFKPINDTFGHAEGDRALMAFASKMMSNFRDSDFSARLGG
jgi:diguanylate cyclase (GGDEF)-like protein